MNRKETAALVDDGKVRASVERSILAEYGVYTAL